MRHNGITLFSVNTIAITIYAILAVLLFAYFVILNNPLLILCSLLLFIIISVFAAVSRKIFWVLFSFSIALITIGSMLFTYSSGPGFLYDNITIFGYYSLIGTVLALFMVKLYQSRNPRSASFAPRVSRILLSRNAILILLVIGIVLLVIPVWPVGMVLHLSKLPYVPISYVVIASGNNSSNLYALSVNPSKYPGLVSPSLGNIRFYYANGTPVQTYFMRNNSYSISQGTMILNLSRTDFVNGSMRMYIFAYNSTFSSENGAPAIKVINGSTKMALGGIIDAKFGNAVNVGPYTNNTISYSLPGWNNYTQKYSVSMAPYLLPEPVCTDGTSRNTFAHINSSANISIFGIYNTSSISAGNGTTAGAIQNYDYYLKGYSRRSYANVINSTNASIYLRYNGSCAFIMIVAEEKTNLTITTKSTFYGLPEYASKVRIPLILENQDNYYYYSSGFIPHGLAYLYNGYVSAISPQNGTTQHQA